MNTKNNREQTASIFLILLLICLNAIAQDNIKSTLLTNITIISADSKNVHNTIGYVLIDDDIIKYVGEKKPELIEGYNVIDGTGRFLIPGLIDSHVHLANTAGFNGQLKNKYPKLLEAYFEQLPKSYLYYGFTTLIDVNNYTPQLINKIKRSELHPDIYTCGNQV